MARLDGQRFLPQRDERDLEKQARDERPAAPQQYITPDEFRRRSEKVSAAILETLQSGVKKPGRRFPR